MLNRQRVLLALITSTPVAKECGLSRLQLMKFAFLFRQSLGEATPLAYEFVPYKFGPFSFALYRELGRLIEKGLISESAAAGRPRLYVPDRAEQQVLAETEQLPRVAWPAVREIHTEHGGRGHDELMNHVYSTYPWYAVNSERSDLIVKQPEEKNTAVPAAYTVGYEGKCIDSFLAGLLRAGIERIIDVRRNPVSRKYGFAKSTLNRHLEKLNLGYVHIPELGIPAEERTHLTDRAAYDALLDRYESTHLPRKAEAVSRVAELLKEKPSALLCMERDPSMCHRSRLAIAAASVGAVEVQHLF